MVSKVLAVNAKGPREKLIKIRMNVAELCRYGSR